MQGEEKKILNCRTIPYLPHLGFPKSYSINSMGKMFPGGSQATGMLAYVTESFHKSLTFILQIGQLQCWLKQIYLVKTNIIHQDILNDKH